MKKKMCDHYEQKRRNYHNSCPSIKGKGNDSGTWVCAGYYKCNKHCEIITRKPKLARVRMWCNTSSYTTDDGGRRVEVFAAYSCKTKVAPIPCMLLIDRKYLKGGK